MVHLLLRRFFDFETGGNYTALDIHHSTKNSFTPITNASNIYSTHLFSNEIVKLIHDHPSNQIPLFIYAPFEAVHGASSCYVNSNSKNSKNPKNSSSSSKNGHTINCKHPSADELQAPEKYITEQHHITNKDRKTFAGMLGAMDEAVLNITNALKLRTTDNMYENTIIIVSTDNGAPYYNFNQTAMSNYPLRGGKAQLWEGGVRAAGFVFGKGVPKGRNSSR
tara:strand:- start:377 stop:1042 length:666 start_codon:yes stop_codon:yes gene_type:complete